MSDVSAVPFINFAQEQAQPQLTQAQAGLVNQQAQAAAMNNQIMRAGMPMYLRATQDEQRMLGPASVAMAMGKPDMMQALQARREARLADQNYRAQYAANSEYEKYRAVEESTQNDVAPIDALTQVDKPMADKIRAAAPNDTDKQNSMAVEYSGFRASNVHQYTGHKVEVRKEDGQTIDDTGRPVAGIAQAGLTRDAFDNIMKQGLSPAKWTDSDGREHNGPAWKSPDANPWGDNTLEGWAQHVAARQKVPGTAPDASPGNRQHAAIIAGQSADKARANTKPVAETTGAKPGPDVTAPPPPTITPQGQPLPGSIYQTNTPAFNKRSADALAQVRPGSPYFNAASGKAGTQGRQGVGPSTVEKGQQEAYVEGVKKLQDDQSDVADATAAAMRNFSAAKQLLQSNTDVPVTGLGAEIQNYLAKKFPGLDTINNANRTEVVKYLTQGAVAQLKPMYGSCPGVFDVKVNLEKAFPSVEGMDEIGLRRLVDAQLTAAQYMRDSAQRVPGYLAKGGEPRYFHTWNEHNFPQAGAIAELQEKQLGPDKSSWEQKNYQGGSYRLRPGTDRTKPENWEKD